MNRSLTLVPLIFCLFTTVTGAEDLSSFPIEEDLMSKGNHIVSRSRDFIINDLLNPSYLEGDVLKIYNEVVVPFFEGLKEDNIDQNLLMEQTSIYMDGTEVASITEYRVGEPYYRGEFLLFPVRILSYTTAYDGELFVFFSDNRWLIEDLELKEQKKGGELFEPSSLLAPF